MHKVLPLLCQKCCWCYAAAGCRHAPGSLGFLGPQHLVPQVPVRVGSHCLVDFLLLLLQSLAAPHDPSPLPSLLPFFPALFHLCFPSLTRCLSFPPLYLPDLKPMNPASPTPACLRAGNTRTYPSSPRKTRPLPSSPQRVANTSTLLPTTPGPWQRDASITLICFGNGFILHLGVVAGLVPHENTHSQMKPFLF